MAQNLDESYLNLLRDVSTNGRTKKDRTGTGTVAVFGRCMKYPADPADFPILTTKKMFFRGIVEELLWFVSGSTNVRPLLEKGIGIWTDDCYGKYRKTGLSSLPTSEYKVPSYGDSTDGPSHLTKDEFVARVMSDEGFAAKWGDLGPVYGKKWRDFGGVDQLRKAVDDLLANPDSRRNLVSAWDPADVPKMTLPPCHFAWQLHTDELTETERFSLFESGVTERTEMPEDFPRRRVNLCFSMRSVDCFLGMCFDVVSYAVLLNLIAREVNMVPGEITMFTGDTHIYNNHIPYVTEQLLRDPYAHKYPKLRLTPGRSMFGQDAPLYTSADITLEGYESYPNWKGVPLST